MKKMKVMVLLAIATMALATGCGKKTQQDATSGEVKQQETQGVNEVEQQEGVSTKSISVTHPLGEIELPMHPKKIVVFDFAALDTIDALGAEVEVAVPTSSVPSFLETYKEVTNAGDIKEPNIEAIYEFAPDMIIISGRQEASYEELSKIAPTWYLPTPDSSDMIAAFEENYTILGTLLGKEEEAKTLIQATKEKVEEVAKLGEASQEKALVILTNDGSISAYGKGSRFGMIHDILKVPAADENIEVSTHGQEVGFEYIAQVNPDILYVVDRNAVVAGSNNASDTLDNELIQGTKAAQNNKIIYLNAENWYIAGNGLRVLPKMIDEIKTSLES